jgi:hypothetical protein
VSAPPGACPECVTLSQAPPRLLRRVTYSPAQETKKSQWRDVHWRVWLLQAFLYGTIQFLA